MDQTNETALSKRPLLHYVILLFLSYITIYGTIALYTDNLLIRSLKDGLMILLVAYALWKVFYKDFSIQTGMICFALLLLTATGGLGILLSGNFITYLYGLKVTILPIFVLFLGMAAARKGLNFEKLFWTLYMLLIGVWLFQLFLGVERLVEMGFVYGVNVKHFIGGMPRLPSLAGTPDSYAFLLALLGLAIERGRLCSRNVKLQWVIRIVTISFLLLATIRSALMFWMVCELIFLLLEIKKRRKENSFLTLSLYSTGAALFTAALGYLMLYSEKSFHLLSYNSLLARLSHWNDYLPSVFSIDGIIGIGIGSVGAASKRVSDLDYQSLNYSVDNQYIAIYEQAGMFGLILFFSFLILVAVQLFMKYQKQGDAFTRNMLILFSTTMLSGLLSNVLEIYPFNVILWLLIGMAIAEPHKKEEEGFVFQPVKTETRLANQHGQSGFFI